MIDRLIAELCEYSFKAGLIEPIDRWYAVNALLEALQLDSFEAPGKGSPVNWLPF